jgi:ubiquinone biosynthesis protein
VVGLLAYLPGLNRHPLREAVAQVTGSLVAQSDFLREARNLDRVHEFFKDRPGARAPMVHGELSGPDLITMELIDPPRSIADPAVGPSLRREAVVTGLRALYRMIFEAGFFHCDLHPGNILLAPDDTVVLVDVGFAGEFGPADRRAFAEFFLSIALRDSRRAAQVIRRTAVRTEPHFDPVAFERDVGSLLSRCAPPRAGEFQIVRFVSGLFRVQQTHGLLGSPNFTSAILALLTYEGLIKQTCPDIDFQKEAIPYLMASLQGC